MSFQRILVQDWADAFSNTTEISSVAIGGRIVSVSDEFFAEAFNLLQVEPPQSFKGQFGPKGALYSGWESRRHNPTYDWCIIKLGMSGTILGFDIDTTHFCGNEAPQVSVSALHAPSQEPQADDARWSDILPKVDLGPNSRHLFKIPESCCTNYVKLNMYPDGGIARFRVYGLVTPVWPIDVLAPFDLAHVSAGGRVEITSDQHFGVGSNLILPGRGKDMGDGWETKRNRQLGHEDWAIIKLGVAGFLEQAEIDTANFMGNFPESCELHATSTCLDQHWTQILPRTKLGPHRRHFFQLENVQGRTFTHVKLTIYPDGGVKRVRIIGRRADGKLPEAKEADMPTSSVSHLVPPSSHSTQLMIIPALPLTPEAFAPFGQVIQAYADHNAAPRGTLITSANNDTASKFHKLGLFESAYPSEAGATSGLSVYRCKPLADLAEDGTCEVRVLERHPFTKQAFIPMGGGKMTGDGLKDQGVAYLVVVAKNDLEGKPDLKTLRAFVATGAQGVMYGMAVWHQPMTVLEKPMDFTCVETQIGNGDKADCEIVELDGKYSVYKVKIGKVAEEY